jgi:hypothetical protein
MLDIKDVNDEIVNLHKETTGENDHPPGMQIKTDLSLFPTRTSPDSPIVPSGDGPDDFAHSSCAGSRFIH